MAAKKAGTRQPTGSKPNYSAPALEKGLDILELLAEQPAGMTQGEIAKALGRSVSEIFRMLNCLVERGYVVLHRPVDTYTLSLKMFELSHRHPPMRRLITEALPVMSEVSRLIDQSCHLTVCHNDRILVVAQVDSPASLGFSVRMGAQLDLLKTASGLVIMAFQSEGDRRRMLHAYQAATGIKPDKKWLDEKFAAIRERGFEDAPSLQVSSVRNISFPVIDFSGHALCAVTVPFLRRVDDENEDAMNMVHNALRHAAATLSSAIGALKHPSFSSGTAFESTTDRRREMAS